MKANFEQTPILFTLLKKELLLAKMQAIDRGENPNKVSEPNTVQTETKPKKKPIFLESQILESMINSDQG